MTVENYGQMGRAVRARVAIEGHAFVSFDGRWEWYLVSFGLERFAGYVDDPRHVAVLDQAFGAPTVSAEAERWVRDRLIGEYFSPDAVSKRARLREEREKLGAGEFEPVAPPVRGLR